jgi:hypothetical protein
MFYLSGMQVDEELLLSIVLSSLHVRHSNESTWFPGMCGWVLSPPQRDVCRVCRAADDDDVIRTQRRESDMIDTIEAIKLARSSNASSSSSSSSSSTAPLVVDLPMRTDYKVFVSIEKSAVEYDVMQTPDDVTRPNSFVRSVLAIETLHITSVDMPSTFPLNQIGKEPLSLFWKHFPRSPGRSRDVNIIIPDNAHFFVIHDYRCLKPCDYLSIRGESSTAFLDFWRSIGYSLIFSTGSIRFRYR